MKLILFRYSPINNSPNRAKPKKDHIYFRVSPVPESYANICRVLQEHCFRWRQYDSIILNKL